MNNIHNILTEMRLCNLEPQYHQLIEDGELHRYKVVGDKSGTKNGWYVIKTIYMPDLRVVVFAVFGSWKLGVKYTWRSFKRKEFSTEDYSKIKTQLNDATKQFAAQKRKEQEKVAVLVANLLHSFVPANPNHRYLIEKRIKAYCALQYGGDIALPIVDCDQKVWSMQTISPDGQKLFFAGGAKRGNFVPVQGWITNSQIGIGEGFATCGTIASRYPNICVVAALDAYNLEPVALAIREFNKTATITIFADDDRQTPGNPGATMARRAAAASGALLASPSWPFGAPQTLTDFNDLHCWLEDQAKEIL